MFGFMRVASTDMNITMVSTNPSTNVIIDRNDLIERIKELEKEIYPLKKRLLEILWEETKYRV